MARPKPLTLAQARLVNELAPFDRDRSAAIEPAVIDTVAPNGAADGSALATVEWRGASGLPMPYLASYAPTVGHVVLLLVQGSQAVILGRIIGLPDEIPADDPIATP